MIRIISVIIICVIISGCVVGTQITKNIEVRKNAAGEILEIIETENIIQRGTMQPLKLEYINVSPEKNEKASLNPA